MWIVGVKSGLMLVEQEKSTGSRCGTGTIEDADEDNEKQEQGNLAESRTSGGARIAGGPGGPVLLLGGGDGDLLHVGFVGPGPAMCIGTPGDTRPATPALEASDGVGLGLGR